MIKNTLFLLLIAINYSFAQTTSGTIIYKKELLWFLSEQEDFKKKNAKDLTYLNNVLRIDENVKLLLKEVKLVLIFNTNKSIFKSDNILELETNKFFRAAIGPEGSKVYYTDTKTQENLHQIDAFGDLFLVSYPQIEWQLHNETKKIGNFNCYKATTIKEVKGRNGLIKTPIEAWYTLELAIPFGPVGFNGLPGLIVELTMRKYKYTIQKIALNPTNEIVIKKPTNGKKVTKQEFENIGLNAMSSFKKGF